MNRPGPDSSPLDGVRSELRRLGYLNHTFERFLLQDALRPRQAGRALAVLTLKVGLLAGSVLALAVTLALAAANGSFATPFDLPVLFLHLWAPIALAAGLAFLALCGLLLAVLRLYPVRRIETITLAAAVVAGAVALAVPAASAWQERALAGARLPELVTIALAVPLAAYALIKLVYHGLLTLAIRATDLPPRRRLFSRRRLGAALLAVVFLLSLPVVLSAHHATAPPPPMLPVAPGERVLLVGLDGVLPQELEYLLAAGELPVLRGLLATGGRLLSYRRGAELPASFWTTVATGLPADEHGVAALDSFLPRGLRTPLGQSGPLRAYWRRVEVPLGLAEYRPVLANRRRAATLWELASRGGRPILAVNWWATFPAAPLPGTVIAHGAYQLLAEGTAGAVAPVAAAAELRAALRATAGQEPPRAVSAALPPQNAAAVLTRALLPDSFYRTAFAARLAGRAGPGVVAAALYLPALDIAAGSWSGGDVAFADLVRGELAAADRLVGDALRQGGAGETLGTVAVVFDPARRRGGGEGRIVLWRRCGCAGGRGKVAPAAIASGLLRALGLPQSAELPPPPAGCPWPPPPARVPSYGRPESAPAPAATGAAGAEYLENLRSLGYL